MKKYNAYTMTMVEYGELLQKLSDNTLDVECDMDGWFYVEAEGGYPALDRYLNKFTKQAVQWGLDNELVLVG